MNSHKRSTDSVWNWIGLPATPRKQIKVVLTQPIAEEDAGLWLNQS